MSQLEEPVCEQDCGSITTFLNGAKEGESFAQHQLWERYLEKLLRMASQRLGRSVRAIISPDDIASIVFHDFLRGLQEGRFRRMENRQDLWQVLIMLTQRRSIDSTRHATSQKRNGLVEQRISSFAYEPQQPCLAMIANEPSPEDALSLQEEFERRLQELPDDRLRKIALAKMSGHTNLEIASKLGCSLRSVERKLSIIRRRWEGC